MFQTGLYVFCCKMPAAQMERHVSHRQYIVDVLALKPPQCGFRVGG